MAKFYRDITPKPAHNGRINRQDNQTQWYHPKSEDWQEPKQSSNNQHGTKRYAQKAIARKIDFETCKTNLGHDNSFAKQPLIWGEIKKQQKVFS